MVDSCLHTLPSAMSPWEALHRLPHPSSSLITFNTSFTLSCHSFVSLFSVAHHPQGLLLPSGWCCKSLYLLTSNDLILSTHVFASHFTEKKEATRQGFPNISTMKTFKLPHQFPNTSLVLTLLWMKHSLLLSQTSSLSFRSSCFIKYISPTIILFPLSLISLSLLGPKITL